MIAVFMPLHGVSRLHLPRSLEIYSTDPRAANTATCRRHAIFNDSGQFKGSEHVSIVFHMYRWPVLTIGVLRRPRAQELAAMVGVCSFATIK